MKFQSLMKYFIELMRCEVRIQTGEEYKDAFWCENSDFIVSDQRPLVPEFGEPDGERERERERERDRMPWYLITLLGSMTQGAREISERERDLRERERKRESERARERERERARESEERE
jgi:hypothetical protein